jgi:hypothetical protein
MRLSQSLAPPDSPPPLACRRGYIKVVSLLLAAGAPLDAEDDVSARLVVDEIL